MERKISVKTASAVGVAGSATNVAIEYLSTQYFGGRVALADMPHQFGDVLAYSAIFVSRFWNSTQHKLESASSWVVSRGSYAVSGLVAAETAIRFVEYGPGLNEQSNWGESAVLAGVLGVNGLIHVAQKNAKTEEYDRGAHINHAHAESEWYATGALLGGAVLSTALGAPLMERSIAIFASAWVGWKNSPNRPHQH